LWCGRSTECAHMRNIDSNTHYKQVRWVYLHAKPHGVNSCDASFNTHTGVHSRDSSLFILKDEVSLTAKKWHDEAPPVSSARGKCSCESPPMYNIDTQRQPKKIHLRRYIYRKLPRNKPPSHITALNSWGWIWPSSLRSMAAKIRLHAASSKPSLSFWHIVRNS